MSQYIEKIKNIFPIVDQEQIDYFQLIYPYFTEVKNKKVLEIGAYKGWHTAIIEDYQPSHITCIEPHEEMCKILNNNFSNVEVIQDDIFQYLEKPRNFDVVVCCGVLYHFHSPLYLLELIANRINPEVVIIETTTGAKERDRTVAFNHAWVSIEENMNTGGARFSIDGWKSIDLACQYNQSVLDYAMNVLGYKLSNEINLYQKTTFLSKKDSLLSVWKRK